MCKFTRVSITGSNLSFWGCHFIQKRIILHSDKFISESCYIKLNLDRDYTFPINLEPNGIPFDSNSIGKM